MHPDQALIELLLELFSADALRRFLRYGPDGDIIIHFLPGESVSPLRIAEAAVDVQKQRGLLDAEFFDRLAAEFPRRSEEIERIRAQFRLKVRGAAVPKNIRLSDGPSSVRPRRHELYAVTHIEKRPLLAALKKHYGTTGVVGTKVYEDLNDPENETVTLILKKSVSSPIAAIEVSPFEWSHEIVAPELRHFWGDGAVIEVHALYGVYEFVFERRSVQALNLDADLAEKALAHLAGINDNLWINTMDWWKHDQFRLLVYSLLKHQRTDLLLDILANPPTDEKGRLRLGVFHTMLHCYMAGVPAGNYSDNEYHHRAQDDFDRLFREHGLDLSLSAAARREALMRLADNDFHTFAKDAIRSLDEKRVETGPSPDRSG